MGVLMLRRALAAAAALAGVALAASTEVCRPDVLLDVVFALDTTSSMRSYLNTMRENLPELLRLFARQYPGSYYGFVTFNDKRSHCDPEYSRGNYCNRIELPLTDNVAAVERKLENASANNGDRYRPEDPLGMIIVAAQHPTMGWRDVSAGSGKVSKKVLIVVTDAVYKKPGDPFYCPSPDARANDGDWDYDCDGEDFPSEEQARVALKKNDVHILWMTSQRALETYQTLLNRIWYNSVNGAAFLISSSASNLIDAVESSVEDIVCNDGNGSGTTPPPPPITVPTTVPGAGGGGGDGGGGGSDDGGDIGDNDDDDGPDVGPIVAGAAGGLVALAAVVASVAYYRRTAPIPLSALDLGEADTEEPADPDREANIQVIEDYYE